MLHRLTRFRTLEEHAQEAAASGWGGGDLALARDALRELVSIGLLVPHTEIVRRITRFGQTTEKPAPISAICWPTKDRPALLLRGMKSFIANAHVHGRAPGYIALNDSTDVSAEIHMVVALSKLSLEEGIAIRYAGQVEKKVFAEEIARRLEPLGLPPELIRFALFDTLNCGLTYGANRNASLLATTGCMALSTDDDIVCAPAPSPELEGGLELAEIPGPGGLHFYSSREELLHEVKTRDTDILAVHEVLLGRKVSGIAREYADANALKLDMGAGQFLDTLMTFGAQVLATAGGSYGDSGMGTPRSFLMLEMSNRERLVSTEKAYREAFYSRELLQVFTRTTITPGPYFPGMNVGLDNRDLLPPFIPVLRGEDFIFAYALKACFKDCAIGYPPWALAHFPSGARNFTQDSAVKALLYFSEIVFIALHSFGPSPGMDSPRDRMGALGTHLQSIASMDNADYESFMKSRWIAQASYRIGLMENSLMEYNHQPSFWARDLERAIKSMEEFALKGEASVPSDLLQGRTPVEARDLGKKILGMYGELLYWWPSIVDAARALKEDEIELTREIPVS
ncbi:MAG: hypothetical protein EPN93_04635 [Spirochaetes bacterium]|nr:MAG: hypothetical protein EPN93_04635 [Spirochaetota bacterium]